MAKEGVEVVEKGDIYFFFRPDVDTPEVKSFSDVQRFYAVLSPDSDHKFRELVIGRKKLPEIGEHARNFGFVEHVFKNVKDLREELGGGEYETKPKGERTELPARAVGEGRYVLAHHDDHTHLAYELELPEKPEQVQKQLRVEKEGSFIITVRNPKEGFQMTSEAPDFPKSILDEFGDRKFSRLADPKMLDYENAEFILIGAKEKPEKELGIDLDAEKESLEESELVKELKIGKDEKRLKPIEEGKWD